MENEWTYSGFLDSLTDPNVISLPDDDADDGAKKEYWDHTARYVDYLYKLFSVETRTLRESFLDKAIRKKFDLEGKDVASLGQYRLELSYVFQNIESVFAPGAYKYLCKNSPQVGKLKNQAAFNSFVTRFYRHTINFINNYSNDIVSRIQSSNELVGQQMREMANRFQSSAQELLEQFRLEADQHNKESSVQLQAAQKMLEETKEQANAVLPNMLTILGIFVTVIVAFISGFSILSFSYSNISSIPQVCFAHFLLMGHVVGNLIFLLMFMVSRLSNKSISTICIYSKGSEYPNECRACQSKCKWNHRVWRKYPYLVALNWAACAGYFLLLVWWYADTFLYEQVFGTLHSDSIVKYFVFLALVGLGVVLVAVLPIRSIFTSEKSK